MTKKNNHSSRSKKQKEGSTSEPLAPFLGRELRVELNDGRVLVGLLVAYLGSGDLLLQAVLEERESKGDKQFAVTVRGVQLLAVPFRYVKSLHRRTEGSEPLTAVLEERVAKAEAAQTA